MNTTSDPKWSPGADREDGATCDLYIEANNFGEDEQLECGCTLRPDDGSGCGGARFYFCPIHAVATEMVEVVRSVACGELSIDNYDKAKAILAKIKKAQEASGD